MPGTPSGTPISMTATKTLESSSTEAQVLLAGSVSEANGIAEAVTLYGMQAYQVEA